MVVFLSERVDAGPHGHAGHVIPPGAEVVHVQAVHPVKLLAREAVGLQELAAHLGGGFHPHLAAEGIVADGLLDRIVAADNLPRTAEVVGDVVVPAGGAAVRDV